MKAIKVCLKPTPEQESLLWYAAKAARNVYNWSIAEEKANHEAGGKFLSHFELRRKLTQLKKTEEWAWLYGVSNNVAKQAVKDACGAFERFFKKQSKFPRFKSVRKTRPAFYHDTEKLKIEGNRVRLEKIGWVSIAEDVPLIAKVYNPRVSFDGKYWYLSFGYEVPKRSIDLTEEVLGIDLGIAKLAVCSNGLVIENINKAKEIKRLVKKLKRKQRRASRTYLKINKGEGKTKNLLRLEKEIRGIHRRIKNIRDNHLHQASAIITRVVKPKRIVVEDLNVSGMLKNRHLSKAIQGMKWYEFVRQLEYKSADCGIEFERADRFYPSSKICSCCGAKKDSLSLSERVYECGCCGSSLDRDLNAAINLSRYRKAG